jgi:protein-tyrosine phosphatase
MIDLHCHILPGIDDGAANLDISLQMARELVADGVGVVACTPHILPGLYHNSGPQIRAAAAALQWQLDAAAIPLRIVTGADNHVVPDFCDGLRSGRLLTIANSRYVLVEPPHHAAPPRLDELLLELLAAGYVPILTHPERLAWIASHFPLLAALARAGVWMQITASSVTGDFGATARYWAERMLDEGLAHILATDAHDLDRRAPKLRAGLERAAKRIGNAAACDLVVGRPGGVIENVAPDQLAMPAAAGENVPPFTRRYRARYADWRIADRDRDAGGGRGGWLRRQHT